MSDLPEKRTVCHTCGQIDGGHLDHCGIASLEKRCEELESSNRELELMVGNLGQEKKALEKNNVQLRNIVNISESRLNAELAQLETVIALEKENAQLRKALEEIIEREAIGDNKRLLTSTGIVAQEALKSASEWKNMCEHGKGKTDYCQPCGRIHSQ